MFIDVYHFNNGVLLNRNLVTQIEIKDPTQQFEVLEFCNENNCFISDTNKDVLIDRETKQPKFFLK